MSLFWFQSWLCRIVVGGGGGCAGCRCCFAAYVVGVVVVVVVVLLGIMVVALAPLLVFLGSWLVGIVVALFSPC